MMNAEFTLPSFAKINLNLRVLGKRPDGFHEIFTVFQTVSLHDELLFSKSDSIEVASDDESIPVNEGNLVHKAIEALGTAYGVTAGISVFIKKRIPSPGGLGGGSSNAAVALMAARRIWGLDCSRDALLAIGAEIGSDVPLFFYGGTSVGTGRGTIIEPVKDVDFKHILIVSPDIKIATPDAYRDLGRDDLTKNRSKSILKHYREGAEALYTGRFEFENDFEAVVFEKYPEIEKTAAILDSFGARAVTLSGSGPSVVGIFESEQDLRKAAAEFRDDLRIRCIPVKTVSRASYFERLELVSGQSFGF